MNLQANTKQNNKQKRDASRSESNDREHDMKEMSKNYQIKHLEMKTDSEIRMLLPKMGVLAWSTYCRTLSPKCDYDWDIEWWWWWIVFVVWLTGERCLALFPAGTIVRDPHHLESPTRCKQDLNLCRTWVQALLNEVVQ